MKFLTKQKTLYLKQFGFRKNFSTANAILNFIDGIENAFDKNKFACGVFIDFKKAFDKVDHEILLKKLWHYGIRGIANGWFKSYLTNRMQYVSINVISSDLLWSSARVSSWPSAFPFVHKWFTEFYYIFLSISFCRWYRSSKHPRQHMWH